MLNPAIHMRPPVGEGLTSECVCQRGLRAILGRAFKSRMTNLRIYSTSYIASARTSLIGKLKEFWIWVNKGTKRICSETLAGLVISPTGNSDMASKTTWFRYPQKYSIFSISHWHPRVTLYKNRKADTVIH